MARKTILLLFLVFAFIHIQAQQLTGQSWSEVLKNKHGVLSIVYHDQPRLITRQQDKMQGLCVDILNDFVAYLKAKHNITLEIKYVMNKPVFDEFLSTVKNSKNILGVANVSITASRQADFLFTPGYLRMAPVLITHKSTPDIVDTEALTVLKKFKAVVIDGSSHEATIRKLDQVYQLQATYLTVESSDKIPYTIHANQHSYSVVDLIEFINATQKKLHVKAHKVVVGVPDELGFVMSKTSDWQPVWNEFLTAEYKESQHYKKSILDNLGQAFMKLM